MKKILEFKSKRDMAVFYSIVGIMLFAVSVMAYPSVKSNLGHVITGNMIFGEQGGYYDMFACPCCGEPIDTECCGMAKARMDYVDELSLKGHDDIEIATEMVKRFGFEVLMDKSMEADVKENLKDNAPENPAVISLEDDFHNLGTISQRDGVISTNFTIKNEGKSKLIIDNLDTSCMCTSAAIVKDGAEGPRFGMDMGDGKNPTDWSMTIAPGESATLKVYYDPMAHGKQKTAEQKIIRFVNIYSNDPVNFMKKVRIDLIQVP